MTSSSIIKKGVFPFYRDYLSIKDVRAEEELEQMNFDELQLSLDF